MNKPHKHAEFIKAKADGFQIQYEYPMGFWQDMKEDDWEFTSNLNFRIKPPAPKWPETKMTGDEAFKLLGMCVEKVGGLSWSNAQDLVLFANEVIKRAIEDGQVVLP